jgi:hypothetical protein
MSRRANVRSIPAADFVRIWQSSKSGTEAATRLAHFARMNGYDFTDRYAACSRAMYFRRCGVKLKKFKGLNVPKLNKIADRAASAAE